MLAAFQRLHRARQHRRHAVGAFEAFLKIYDKGVIVRSAADILILSPAFIIEEQQIGQIVDVIREVLPAIG